LTEKKILIVGTYDTKDAELRYLAERITSQGGRVVSMDVSVLGTPSQATDYSKHDVADAANSTIADVIASGDENSAMQIMARGASALAARLHLAGRFDGVILLGGTMGTDLALDVCLALPLGVPKYVVSTVAFSPLIPPQRLAADIQMILWAGGLYGLNSICKSSLSQAAGAVLGAARAAEPMALQRPLIGMTSLGKTALTYMVTLNPALEKRGYEVAIFHATGMGGRAFENLCAQRRFAAVMDFCTQELGNDEHGSNISAGADRLTNAGKNGIPQIVAPGCYDLVDIIGWQPVAEKWLHHDCHAHNRLISSVVLTGEEREQVALAHARQLATAVGETHLILPNLGCGEWDRPGGDLHDQAGLAQFCSAMRQCCPANVQLLDLDAHINDPAFAEAALRLFDDMVQRGIIPAGKLG
jgi:uncharacterized protein (UPF0261 family)